MSAMGTLMIENAFSEELIHRLAERYEEDPTEFTQLPQPTVASAFARQTVSELRNEGLVEEEVRGVIRLTPRGYKEYKRKSSFSQKAWA
jgi:Mn-dependent DtxR family transcriptional regulator